MTTFKVDTFEQQAQRIKALRKSKGLSQAQLALYCGLSRTTVTKYERHGCTNLAIASKMAKVLNTSLDVFRV